MITLLGYESGTPDNFLFEMMIHLVEYYFAQKMDHDKAEGTERSRNQWVEWQERRTKEGEKRPIGN